MSGCATYRRNRWYAFDLLHGLRQALPPVGHPVLVRGTAPEGLVIAVGLRRNHNGTAQCKEQTLAFFEMPHGWTSVEAWNDCLMAGITAEDLAAKIHIPRKTNHSKKVTV